MSGKQGYELFFVFQEISQNIFSLLIKYLVPPKSTRKRPPTPQKNTNVFSLDFQNTPMDSKMTKEFIDGILNQNSPCFAPNTSSDWSKKTSGLKEHSVGTLPKPYSDEWQGWATEKKNFKRCGNPKCLTRQRNGRGFACWVPGCEYVFKETITAKRKYHCKSNPAPENYQQIRKKMRRKYNKNKNRVVSTKKAPGPNKSKKAKNISPQTSKDKSAIDGTASRRIADMMKEVEGANSNTLPHSSGLPQLDDTELLFDPELFNDEMSTTGAKTTSKSFGNESDVIIPPKLTRENSLTPITDADSDVQFNYDAIPIQEVISSQKDDWSSFDQYSELFDEFFPASTGGASV